MATLRDIKLKISAIKKIQQITRAMNMVASAKLRNTQSKMEKFDPYAKKFAEVLGNLASRIDSDIHPLMVKRENIANVELLLFSSDRGLCGSFNMNNFLLGEKWVKEQKDSNREYNLNLVGRKGRDYFKKRNYNISSSHVQIYGSVNISYVNKMTSDFIHKYMNGEIDELYMAYSKFVSVSKQIPTLVKLLPIEPPAAADTGKNSTEYLCEPGAEELLIDLLPKHISVQILNAFFQNEVSEYAARMAAMDNATKNCKDMVQDLTLTFNKARQAAITAELMDIVGGAEALR
ncbi:MAG: ATP synthase F1 subunit gamma [Deltaproteobacteria bacterium]|nr:ATP synthase F1 subunit gamma [Deltaproteobacteria bacterium]